MAIEAPRARAAYAADPEQSRGRLHAEALTGTRNPFRRDCDRIIHSTAFRRLAYKTQVFVFHEGDHFRTRLTHTLEVVQIARSLARALGLDEDLSEALALAHDLGHPPFGHAGERALDQCLAAHGGFDHNEQALRIVAELERRYPDFDGLNLTWETLEGLVKHNGPLLDATGQPAARYRERGVPAAVLSYSRRHDLKLADYASAEAQVAAIADDIAYDAHDIDDGLRADLFTLDAIADVPIIGDIAKTIKRQYPALEAGRRVHETVRLLITRMIDDVVAETDLRTRKLAARSADEVRAAREPVVTFSAAMAKSDADVKGFLYPRMYRHQRVAAIMADAEKVLRDLFDLYVREKAALPAEWTSDLPKGDEGARARRIADYIAGMTDRYALIEHARHFDSTPELR